MDVLMLAMLIALVGWLAHRRQLRAVEAETELIMVATGDRNAQ